MTLSRDETFMLIFLQIYSLNDADEIARRTNFVVAGFIGLALFSGIIYFLGVSCTAHHAMQ